MRKTSRVLSLIVTSSIVLAGCSSEGDNDTGVTAGVSTVVSSESATTTDDQNDDQDDVAPVSLSNEELVEILKTTAVEETQNGVVPLTDEQINTPEMRYFIEEQNKAFPIPYRLDEQEFRNLQSGVENNPDISFSSDSDKEEAKNLQPLTDSEIDRLADAADVINMDDVFYLDFDNDIDKDKHKIIKVLSALMVTEIVKSNPDVDIMNTTDNKDDLDIDLSNVTYKDGIITYDSTTINIKESAGVTTVEGGMALQFDQDGKAQLVYKDGKWKKLMDQPLEAEDLSTAAMLLSGEITL